MRRKKYYKYKGLNQVSNDLYYHNKKSVKIFTRLCILQICFAMVARKKQLLRVMYLLYSKRYSSKRIYSKINSLFLPSVEKVLHSISNKTLSLTKKTRLFKYFKRKNFQLFALRSLVLSDLLFIITGKRKKPFSRRTLWDHLFYMKQELRQFYPSLTKNMFSRLAGNQSNIDLGVEWLLFNLGYTFSVWQSRQLVSHGKVKRNSNSLSVCTTVGNVGDVFAVQSPIVVSKLQYVTCIRNGLQTFGFVFGNNSFSIIRSIYKSIYKNVDSAVSLLGVQVCYNTSTITTTPIDLFNLWKWYVSVMRVTLTNVVRQRDRVLVGFSKKTTSLVDKSLMFSRGVIWNRNV